MGTIDVSCSDPTSMLIELPRKQEIQSSEVIRHKLSQGLVRYTLSQPSQFSYPQSSSYVEMDLADGV